MTDKLRRGSLMAAGAAALLLGGCHTDMWTQPKIHKPLQASDFFVDEQSARAPVPNTVARGTFTTDDAYVKGMQNGKLVRVFPFAISRNDLARGQERFNIYCSPCHGRLGYGDGMIARRGFNIRKKPGNYHTPRLRKMPVGHFFDVITHGFGVMYSYASRIQDVRDRWRIVAYIKALQLSQNANPSEVEGGVDLQSLPLDMHEMEPAKR